MCGAAIGTFAEQPQEELYSLLKMSYGSMGMEDCCHFKLVAEFRCAPNHAFLKVFEASRHHRHKLP